MGDFGAIGAWLLLAAVIARGVLIGVGSVRLGSRVLSAETGPEHNSALSPFVTVVGLVYGALLGFTVVVGWQEFLSAEVAVLLGLLLFLVFTLDHPFGPLGVTSQPFAHAVTVFDEVDSGN